MTKAKRRPYGSGSVHQRASDGRWIGVLQAGYSARGTRRVITVSCSAAAGEAECRRRLARKQAEVARDGLPVAGVTSRATVKSWADQWLAETGKRLRPKSWTTDKGCVTKWIVPTIGHRRLDHLTPADVRAVSTAVRTGGRTSSTALRVHVVLCKMLRDAIIEGHQVPQRVLMVTRPGVSVSDRDAVGLQNALSLLDGASRKPDGSRWVAALLQGMRQGECLGLTWSLVDFDGSTLDVSWQLQALPYRHGCSTTGRPECGRRFGGDCPARELRVPDGYEYRVLDGQLCLVRPKTEAGQRIIPLIPWMATALQTWRSIAPPSQHDLVWPMDDGQPRRPSDDRAAWKALQAEARVKHSAGRPYQLHEARHTTATLLMEAGVEREVIKAILGQASIVAQLDYKHVSQELARRALEQIGHRLQLGA